MRRYSDRGTYLGTGLKWVRCTDKCIGTIAKYRWDGSSWSRRTYGCDRVVALGTSGRLAHTIEAILVLDPKVCADVQDHLYPRDWTAPVVQRCDY